MANRKISYTTRDYQGIRTELLNYVRTYYPELIQDFNDASVFSVFLDLLREQSIRRRVLTQLFSPTLHSLRTGK